MTGALLKRGAFWDALLQLEEVMNETITDYLERGPVTDGGAELIDLTSRAMSERTEWLCAQEMRRDQVDRQRRLRGERAFVFKMSLMN